MAIFEPIYIRTHTRSLLKAKIAQAKSAMQNCTMCPRRCAVDRTAEEMGYCRTGKKAIVAAYQSHFGEEAPLVGRGGSGTIFFSNCSLRCNFCQNYDISHSGEGRAVDDETLASIMLALQQSGCHNINLVTPTHVVPQILAALPLAIESGLTIPLVYNTSGYERVKTLKLLEGVIDIYLPDFKFWRSDVALLTCQAADYPPSASRALKEMHRQVGDLVVDAQGIARRGLMVRHLVMPEDMAGTGEVMRFIVNEISPHTYVNIMRQYRPLGEAGEMKTLARAITATEFKTAMAQALLAGLTRVDE